MISDDEAPPVDRPNLSKDYLSGKAPEDWIPLRNEGFYAKNGIDLRLGTKVAGIDIGSSEVALAKGELIGLDKLLLATGAEPVRLTIPGADLPHVHTLRSLADSRSIIADIGGARHAVVLGASFIGLEVAAADGNHSHQEVVDPTHEQFAVHHCDGGTARSRFPDGLPSLTILFQIQGSTAMSEEAFNMSIRKFLKEVGVTSQRKIEETVRDRQIGGKNLKVRITLTAEGTGLNHVVEGEIELP
ncbi:DUF6494 family protein [Rhizobium grahamii]